MKNFFPNRPKHFFFFLFQFIAAINNLYCQEKVVLDENKPYQRIGKSVYFLKDPKNEFQFSDVTSRAFENKYVKSDQDANNLGNIDMAVWNRFTITNPTRKKWLLAIESYNIDKIEFYYPDSLTGEYRMLPSGRYMPFSSRKYKTNNYIFDLPLSQSTATFYLKVESFYMQYPVSVYTQEEFVKQSHQKDLLTGVYYGLVIVFMLYNLFVFFSVRDKSYLYYVVFIFFNALLIAQVKGLTAELFGDRFHFFWPYSPAIIGLCSAFSFIFTRQVLETKRYAPRWDKVITHVFYPNYILIILLSIMGKNLYASMLNQLSGICALGFLFTIAISVYRKGFKPARFYIVACFFYFLGILIYVLKGFNLLPFNDITNSSIEAGSTLQMFLFAFVIADRLKIFKKEKENAQTELVASLQENEKLILEQKQVLEIKVKERTQELQNTLQDLTKEKLRSDELLLNILPFETAEELKQKGKSDPKFFDSVTIMFTDFKNFTGISEKLSPDELVSEIDYCFREFDRIINEYDIEKIKTIGDSYMAAGGLPVANKTHAKDVVKAAIAIQQFIIRYNKERSVDNKALFEIRIGIHTGSVVAGIVGSKKFAYDIWGDAVNTASRMESSGEPGRVNISGATYELVKDEFNCEYRGKIVAKNKGEIDMYFLN